jgi:hypothetical protein
MSIDIERRSARRAAVHLFCNQYIDGMPYLTEAIELSMRGALVRRLSAPNQDRASYAIEIGEAHRKRERVWLAATPVWRLGNYEALRFVGQSETDRLRLADLLHAVAPVRAA